MPKVSKFYAIGIYFYFDDHPPPHFHAYYGEYQALIAIESLEVIEGYLPGRAMSLVVEWAIARREELRRAWQQASQPAPIAPIEPLA